MTWRWSTGIVVFTVVFLMAFLAGADWVLARLAQKILRIGG